MNLVKFLGIYSGKLPPTSTVSSKALTDRKYWYIWFNQKEQNYIIQALNKSDAPPNTPYTISILLFGLNFVEETSVRVPQPPPPHMATLKNHEEESANNLKQNTFVRAKRNMSNSPTTNTANTHDTEKDHTLTDNPILAAGKGAAITHLQNNYSANQEKETKTNPLGDNPDEEKLLLPKNSIGDKLENIKAIRIDREFRSEFSSAMFLWEKGTKGVASVKFNNLLKRNDDFIKAHKHMFTDCAIKLRKIHQNDLALTFAMRCTDLSPEDSHTFFNVGRLYYELREYKSSSLYLEKCLELESDLPPALTLYAVVTNTLARVAKTRG